MATAVERKREELLKSGVYRVDGKRIFMEKDYLFNSPSQAAAFIAGKAANGWTDWKDGEGRTLDELERQKTDNDPTDSEPA